jgi:hypothetical protein
LTLSRSIKPAIIRFSFKLDSQIANSSQKLQNLLGQVPVNIRPDLALDLLADPNNLGETSNDRQSVF